VVSRLESEGWTEARKGPGDHVQYKHPTRPGRVTVDKGARRANPQHAQVDLPASRMGLVKAGG